jgi:hypothetical protein
MTSGYMDENMRATIAWLNSWEGRRWSRSVHRQSPYAIRMFSLKEEGHLPGQVFRSWGSVDSIGRYRKPSPDE